MEHRQVPNHVTKVEQQATCGGFHSALPRGKFRVFAGGVGVAMAHQVEHQTFPCRGDPHHNCRPAGATSILQLVILVSSLMSTGRQWVGEGKLCIHTLLPFTVPLPSSSLCHCLLRHKCDVLTLTQPAGASWECHNDKWTVQKCFAIQPAIRGN